MTETVVTYPRIQDAYDLAEMCLRQGTYEILAAPYPRVYMMTSGKLTAKVGQNTEQLFEDDGVLLLRAGERLQVRVFSTASVHVMIPRELPCLPRR